MVALLPPSSDPYVVGVSLAVISQVICMPLCVLAYLAKGRPIALTILGTITAAIGLYFPPLLVEMAVSRGMGTAIDCLLGRFLGATMYAFAALRMFGAAVGATPKGADADLSTWITFATGAVDITFDDDGKPIQPPRGAMLRRTGELLLRLFALSVASSLSEPFNGYPLSAYLGEPKSMLTNVLASYVDHVFVQTMIIWLFLSSMVDVGSLMLMAQSFMPIRAFHNPIFTSTSARIFWGRRWNIQVTVSFKRCVFTPLRKVGTPPALAALVTFVASGLFHEYQFACAFPNYRLGRITVFFVLHGLICAADALFSKAGGKYVANVPWQLKAWFIPFVYSPTLPLFAQCWIEEGFFTLIAKMGARLVL